MVIQAHRVFNDWFEVSRVAHIPYKVYVPVVPKDESLQIVRAATALRHEDPSVLCYSKGRELWLFGRNEPPAAPPQRFNLVQSHKGTVLPSASALPHSTSAERPERYLAAVRNMVVTHMVQTQHYLPFGEGLYDPKSGELIHIVPGITIQGTLHLRLNSEATHLRPSLSKETPIVWLIPLGRQARLVDTFAAPSPTLAQHFAEVLSEICYINLPQITEGLWVQVRCDNHDVIWPQALVVTSQEPPMNLGWLKYLDNPTRILEQTQEMATVKPETCTTDSSQKAPTHHHHLLAALPSVYMPPPLPPPPPTPSATTHEGLYPTPKDNSPEMTLVADPIHTQVTSDPQPLAPPPPAAVAPVAPQEIHAPSTVEEWQKNEWSDENEEVTIADFNFFDVPAVQEAEVKPEPEVAHEVPDAQPLLPPPKTPTPAPETRQSPNPLEMSPHKRAHGAFAPLDFNTSIDMDSKYLEGGRYFTPQEEDEGATKSESTFSSSDESMDNKDGSDSSSNELDFSDGDISMIDEGELKIPDPWSFKPEPDITDQASAFREYDRHDDPQLYFSISSQRHNDVSTYAVDHRNQPWHAESWVSLLTSTPKPSGTDYISDECVQELMVQVVWDNGNLAYLGQGSTLGIKTPVKPIFVNGLKPIYPAIRRITLADVCADNSQYSGHNLASRPMSPAIPGAESLAKPMSPAPTNTPEDYQFTLLSPPLYSIKRMNQFHKARAAILRFWRTFGLQPIGGKRDIVVVQMALSSRIRARTRDQMLTCMKAMYEGSSLGTLTLPTVGPVKNGIMEISDNLEYVNPDTLGDLYENACAVLKHALAEKYSADTKVLLLMSWPATHRASALPLARGFLAIKSGFPNLRWQLLSNEHHYLYPDEMGTKSLYYILKTALMWYDRWVGRTAPGLEPAFKLARLVPHSINLRYDVQAQSQIFDTDPTMHISYAISPDRRWVAVAWTDQWASVTRIKTYRLVAPDMSTVANSPSVDGESTTISGSDRLPSVFRRIWVETINVCSQFSTASPNTQWRVALIKCGPIDPPEVEMWIKVHASVAWESTSSINILSIPRYSPLSVHDGEMLFPHVGMASNDPTAPPPRAATPEDSNGARRNDNVIVSALDETHGIVFETKIHELENSAPVIAAGIFLKPLNPPAFFGSTQLEITLVHGVNVTKNSMKQILGQFRRLSSLSENTGMCADTAILPWHVSAVQKMVQALSVI